MSKRIVSILIVVMFLLVSIGIVMAEGEGNSRKGKYLYRKNCRTCHSEDGPATDLSPVSKTQAEWKAIFENSEGVECKAEWEKRSDKDRQDIYAYLHGHAFDSPSPAKCK